MGTMIPIIPGTSEVTWIDATRKTSYASGMKFIFKRIDGQKIGWFPEGCESSLTHNVTANMIAHDMIDHGIIAQGDYSIEGEHVAYGSYLWWNGRGIGSSNYHNAYTRLIKEGFDLSRERFPNKIVIPLEAQIVLDKLINTAIDEYRIFNHINTKRFDIDAYLDGRTLKIIPKESSMGLNPRPYRLF